VITIHGSDVPGYNPDRFRFIHRLIRPVWRKIIDNASCVITPSRFLGRLLNESIEVETTVIPNGIDFPDPGDVRKRNRIAIVTRMFERKGVQHFLEAVRDLDTDWEIVVAGDGPYLTHLREMAERVRPGIEFLGFIRGRRLTDLYHSSKVFVFPSIQENFPVVLLEAMNAGCAVITTTAYGCAEVVGDAAVKVPPGDVVGLREAVTRLIRDEDEIHRLSDLARQRATGFTSDNIARQYEALFRRIAKPARLKVA
jgi:glycosyltransferase involved in cell wall biosynthesis